MAPLTPGERGRILAVAIITVFVIFFWLAFEQVGSSLNVFAAHRTDRLLGGWLGWVLPGREIPAAWFQAINPFFVLLLAPLMAGLWRRLGTRAPSTPGKMALGLILLGLAYVVMVMGPLTVRAEPSPAPGSWWRSTSSSAAASSASCRWESHS